MNSAPEVNKLNSRDFSTATAIMWCNCETTGFNLLHYCTVYKKWTQASGLKSEANVSTLENNLCVFCERHIKTVEHLSLSEIFLVFDYLFNAGC